MYLLSSSALLLASGSILDEVVFSRPSWALAYLVVGCMGLAYVWGARQRRKAVAALGHAPMIARLLASVDPTKRAIKITCSLAATMLVATGLLRLQYGGIARKVQSSGLDIVLAVDYSKSMLAEDVFPNRSERLEAELGRFLEDAAQRQDRVGIVVFAGAARGLPMTDDMRLIRLYMEKADPLTENPGGTAIGKALNLALDFLVDARTTSHQQAAQGDSGEADQVIVLLTDGEDTVSRPLELAAKAASLGIRIYTVGIGSTSGEPVAKYDQEGKKVGFQTDKDGKYVMTRLDSELLRKISAQTSGEYVQVQTENFVLDEVRSKMASLSRAKRQESVEIHREEGYVILVLPAVLLLCVALALGERRRKIA